MPTRHAYLLAVFFGFLTALQYARITLPQCFEPCTAIHVGIIDGTIGSPFTYRILAAFAVEGLLAGNHNSQAVITAYVLAHLAAFPAMMVALLHWFRHWLSPERAVIGVGVVWALSYTFLSSWVLALYNAVEIILLCAALLLIVRRRGYALVCALTAVAALNRETAVLIPLAYAAYHLPRLKREWVRAGGLLLIWAAVFVGLRFIIGARPDDIPIARAWALNTGGGWETYTALFNHLPFLPLWIMALANLRQVSAPLRRLALICIPYAALFAVFAVWWEVRLLLPVVALFIPIALSPREE